MKQLINSLFKYNYHDCHVSWIKVDGNNVKICFQEGAYLFNRKNTKSVKSNPFILIISIDRSVSSIVYDSFFIYSISQENKISIADIENTFSKKKLTDLFVFNIFFSKFNSMILIDASNSKNRFLIEISNCVSVSFISCT